MGMLESYLKRIIDAWYESESTIPVGKHEILHAAMADARKYILMKGDNDHAESNQERLEKGQRI